MSNESSTKQNWIVTLVKNLWIKVKDLWIKQKGLLARPIIWLSAVPMAWLVIIVLCLGVYMWRVSYLQSSKQDQVQARATQTAAAGTATAAVMQTATAGSNLNV